MDKQPKEKILFTLAFAAILCTPLINESFGKLQATLGSWTLPLSSVSVFLVFGAVFWVFNEHLWKCKYIRNILLMPDLNGTWECTGSTKIKNGETANYNWTAELTITQSWSKISVRLKTKDSVSHSTAASITRLEGQGFKVLYHYQNSPTAIADNLNKHDGASEIIFDTNCSTGSGHYFTDRHRSTVGKMDLRKL